MDHTITDFGTVLRKINGWIGPFLTVVLGAFILLGICLWFQQLELTEPSDSESREISALRRLEELARAQEAYIKKDWDRDGKKSYARFLVHLWQSVGARDGVPVRVGLIPWELAFSAEPTSPLDGFRFGFLLQRDAGDGRKQPLDYGREWAAAAYPALIEAGPGKKARLAADRMFVLFSDGALYSTQATVTGIHDAPLDLVGAGYEKILESRAAP